MLSWIKTIFQAFWRGLTFIRQTIANVLLLVVLVGIALCFVLTETPTIENNTTLVINLSGNIVEKASMSSDEKMFLSAFSETEPETRLVDVIDAFKRGAEDPRITAALVKLDSLGRVGLASVREIGFAMDCFKKTGKKITVWGSGFSQKQYAIAAHASEVFLNPMGQVMLTGLTSDRLYWGELLKKAGVTVHVFKAGDFKSFPESFVRNAPSAESLEADRFWISDAWQQLSEEIEHARGLMPGTVHRLIENLENDLVAAHGNMSEVAYASNLVDGVKTVEEVEALLRDRQGGEKKKIPLRSIGMYEYLSDVSKMSEGNQGVGLITLEGEIIEGESDVGHIGAKTVLREIKRARKDPNVAALLIRLDSPGGSAQASEMIRSELELTRKAGKPVVISMGDTAASGGFWISLAADKVVADPMTVTGSIGVFGVLPTFEKLLEKASVGTGGIRTEWISDLNNPMKPMHPRLETVLRLTVARTYEDFISLVAKARGMSVQAVKPLAQGRVYMGRQAKAVGLVDELGGMDDAEALARKLAKLDDKAPTYFIEETREKVSFLIEKLLLRLLLKLNLKIMPPWGESLLNKASERVGLSVISTPGNGILVHSLTDITW